MPSTYGSRAFADAPAATADGLVPRRLRAAGAIVVGKTNQPEFAFAGFTTNTLYGTTTNPWGTDWSPGGSSGGSAAALAAGMAAIATATDGGGSIRIPAAFCGLAGLQADERRDRARSDPRMDRSLHVRPVRDVHRRRAAVVVDRGRARPGGPVRVAVPAPDGRTGLPSRALADPPLRGHAPAPGRRRRAVRGRARVRGAGPRAAGGAARARLDLHARVDGRRLVHALRRSSTCTAWAATSSSEHMDVFSPNFRDHDARTRSTIDPDAYMAARRRRFDHVRDLDLLLGDDTVLLTPTMCVEGFHPEGTGPDRGAGRRVQHGRDEHHGTPVALGAGRAVPERHPVRPADHGSAVPRRPGLEPRRRVGGGQPLAARRTGLRTVLGLNPFRQDARSRRSNVTSATVSATAAIATSTDRWGALKPFRSGSYSM